MKKILRILAISLILALLGGLLFNHFSKDYIRSRILSQLHLTGIESSNLEIASLRAGSIELRQVHASTPAWDLTIDSLRSRFHLQELWKGSMETLEISDGQLDIHSLPMLDQSDGHSLLEPHTQDAVLKRLFVEHFLLKLDHMEHLSPLSLNAAWNIHPEPEGWLTLTDSEETRVNIIGHTHPEDKTLKFQMDAEIPTRIHWHPFIRNYFFPDQRDNFALETEGVELLAHYSPKADAQSTWALDAEIQSWNSGWVDYTFDAHQSRITARGNTDVIDEVLWDTRKTHIGTPWANFHFQGLAVHAMRESQFLASWDSLEWAINGMSMYLNNAQTFGTLLRKPLFQISAKQLSLEEAHLHNFMLQAEPSGLSRSLPWGIKASGKWHSSDGPTWQLDAQLSGNAFETGLLSGSLRTETMPAQSLPLELLKGADGIRLDGGLSLTADFQCRLSEHKLQSQVRLDQLSISKDKIQVTDSTGVIHVNKDGEEWILHTQGAIMFRSLSFEDIILTEGSIRFAMSPHRSKSIELNAHYGGGAVKLIATQEANTTDAWDLFIHVRQVPLDELATKLPQFKGSITGGLMSGHLELNYEKDTMTYEYAKLYLEPRAPAELKYKDPRWLTEGLSTNNPRYEQLKLAEGALEHFTIESLALNVDSNATDQPELSLNFSGFANRFLDFQGHTIRPRIGHFNLRVFGPIQELLKQLSQDNVQLQHSF